MSAHAWAPALAASGLLAWRMLQSVRGQAAQRRAVLDDCTALLGEPSVHDHGTDYPCLRGRYGGAQVEVQPLLDHVGFRKLPSVWLLLTLRAPLFGEPSVIRGRHVPQSSAAMFRKLWPTNSSRR